MSDYTEEVIPDSQEPRFELPNPKRLHALDENERALLADEAFNSSDEDDNALLLAAADVENEEERRKASELQILALVKELCDIRRREPVPQKEEYYTDSDLPSDMDFREILIAMVPLAEQYVKELKALPDDAAFDVYMKHNMDKKLHSERLDAVVKFRDDIKAKRLPVVYCHCKTPVRHIITKKADTGRMGTISMSCRNGGKATDCGFFKWNTTYAKCYKK
jgi:hypothetical protein